MTKSYMATSPLTVATRLLQFASSYGEIVTADTSDEETTTSEEDSSAFAGENLKLALPSNKVSAFLNDVDSGDFGDSSIVVFAQSRQLIDLLSEEMTRKKLPHGLITGAVSTEDRQRHIDDFQAGKTKFILVTIAAGGVGLTLTAADTMAFIQRSYSSTGMSHTESTKQKMSVSAKLRSKTKYTCNQCGLESTANNLGYHQSKSGHTGRTAVE